MIISFLFISFLFISGEKNSRLKSERRETTQSGIWAFWAQMANDGQSGAVLMWDRKYPSYLIKCQHASTLNYWAFNCAKEILTHNLLSSYPVHCAFKHYYEKLAMKNARCWSSEKLIQQEKIHRWWSQAVCEVLNREPHLTMGEWSIFQMGWNSGGSSGSRHQGKTILLWAGPILFFCVCLNILENEVYFPIKTISRLRFSSLSSNVYNSYGSWKIHFKFQWIVENPLQK